METKIEYRDPAELSISPAVKDLPLWTKEDPKYCAMLEDVRARGFDLPLIIDPNNRIWDGRRRYKIAKDLQLTEVPVVVRKPDDLFGVAVGSLLHRQHYTKGQLAYVLAPLLEDAFAESERRKLANLAKNPNYLRTAFSAARLDQQPKSAAEWAEKIGVSERLFRLARELHELFRKHKEKRELTDDDGVRETGVTFKEFYEPRILRALDGEKKPYGLGAVKAGIGAHLSERVHSQAKQGELNLFMAGCDVLTKRLDYWEEFDDSAKAQAREAIQATVAKMSEELRGEWESAIRKAKKGAK